ncbi:hypothetical protein NEUTE1DRAFT_148352 [Neurospora tetrasperma FGSC 2508]|uniref:Heterokaryon incompatibility domain-containing protein n=1 Tax=Neurospora tetrasperma (strain FGSC 2508 / ATCC MYA-4615 / P0657) TaxID=510951 RepID=F8MSZ3_NEUT8|nr:uncharacterized protein NEUTE1DRAFT_148352 [Neurospora tetrasperma FGSC 2508]EGO55975.1 hypothetical protein NEUTE1DRAFT_148352 [Neurospora tetrasperma FGSC 2508]
MEGKRSRVRHAFDDGGRLSTAYGQVVAKRPFLHVKEQEQQQQQEELQEDEEEEKQQEEVGVEEEEHEDSPNLCQRCKELDLDTIFNGLCPIRGSKRLLCLAIRGIDCTTRKIVDLRPGDNYIALSYVWGNQPLVENKGSRVLPTNAPKIVEDAMIVVKELGQQYLWVDQYCIDQHDDQDKHAQIKNMDRIYEGSYATIVAFSGKDSSSGLPGVSSIPRMPQHRFTSPKMTLLGFTPALTQQTLEASIWMKRGWTFQEALLSRRLLIFTQEQVHFLCSRGWWVESCAPRPLMLGERTGKSPSATAMTVQSTSASTIHWATQIILA